MLITGMTFNPAEHMQGYDYGLKGLTPAGGHVLQRTDLYLQDGVSDKVYIVTISSPAAGHPDYTVQAFYGRRGSTTQSQTKYQGNQQNEAMRIAAKLVTEKTNKGYKRFQGAGFTTTSQLNASVATGISLNMDQWVKPMMWSHPVSKQRAKKFFEEPEFILEEQLDGQRVVVHYPTQTCVVYGVDDKENLVDITAALPYMVTHLNRAITLGAVQVGTILDGVIYADGLPHADVLKAIQAGKAPADFKLKLFDVLSLAGSDFRFKPWKERRKALTTQFENMKATGMDFGGSYIDSPKIPVMMTRYVLVKKEELYEQLGQQSGGLGGVFKSIHDNYDPKKAAWSYLP